MTNQVNSVECRATSEARNPIGGSRSDLGSMQKPEVKRCDAINLKSSTVRAEV